MWFRAWYYAEDDFELGAQERLKPSQEQFEVVARGGEDGVGAVAFAALEVVAAHAVLGLEVADHRLDGGAAPHLAADGFGDSAHLVGDPDPELVRIAVAPIALVDVDAAGLYAGQLLNLSDDGVEGMTVIGLAVQRLGMEDELAALTLGGWRGDRDVASELERRPGLALADALDLGGVQVVELPAALTVALVAYLIGP